MIRFGESLERREHELDETSRARISRKVLLAGTLLLAVVASHVGWCAWSLPRYGVVTAHGLETTACNWGTAVLGSTIGVLALITFVTGLVGHWARSRATIWAAVQLPAIVSWPVLIFVIAYSS